MTNQELSEEQIVQAIYAFAAEQMKNGFSSQEIQSMLVEQGLERTVAATIVANLNQARTDAIHKVGRKNIFFGAAWCIGGIVLTAATYNDGGTVIIAWGAIVFGAIQFFRGLGQSAGG